MKFTKMHGAGNDFVIIDLRSEHILEEKIPEFARMVCRRRESVGADGLMLVTEAQSGGDFRLLFYNSDGSLGEMCGNGARCIARYGFEHGLSGSTQHIETTAGLVIGERITQTEYRIRLNDPSVLDERCVDIDGRSYLCGYVELGSPGIPHAVTEWPEVGEDELRALGRSLRYAKEFPKGANVSFVRLTGTDEVKAVTYERGVEDFTLACGTGCGSICSVLYKRGLVSGNKVRINMPGGALEVSLRCDDGRVHDIYLTGPTCLVYSGELTGEGFQSVSTL